MRAIFILLLTTFTMCVAAPCQPTATAQAQQKPRHKTATRYSCPMHPEVVSRRPGTCPKCGMALRAGTAEETPAASNEPPASVNNSTATAAKATTAVSSLHIPDTPVYDQNGKRLNFYTDLIKGKTVAINFIFTTCTTICPPLTATFRRVQQQLGERSGREVQLISISVDPVTDVPERLRDFAAKFKAGPGWTFVTGDQAEIDSLLKALGAAVANKNDHTPMILVGNDATGYWTRTYGLSSSSILVKVITEAAERK